jgi:hypothetical protein
LANTKRFENPVQFTLRIEQASKKRIAALTDNATELINVAINRELLRRESDSYTGSRKVSK